MFKQIMLYDSTLQDGTQGEQINFSAEDKRPIAQKLDEFDIRYVEEGWPEFKPKDTRFFSLEKKYPFRPYGSLHSEAPLGFKRLLVFTRTTGS